MTDDKDPWASLVRPAAMTDASGRRVDPALQWNIYWALDVDGGCLLVFRHLSENRPKNRLPRPSGLEVEARSPQQGSAHLLIVRLKDNEQRDIFHRLCLDMIDATRPATSEPEAIERFLGRIWRWHWLLRGGRGDRLTEDEQKGAIGELHFMQCHLFPSVGVETGVRSWAGPMGSPKDFEVGRTCIEVKARRGAAAPYVAISTQDQLDTEGVDALFLHVAEVTATSADDPKGISVTDKALSIRAEVQAHGTAVAELLEQRLGAIGFDWAHDYSDSRWLIGNEHVYRVVDGFPRITPGMYPSGVANVRYSISLQDCEPYRTNHAAMIATLGGQTNGD